MTKSLTIAQVGNFQPPWSTENDLRRSLEELGHQPIPLQEDEALTWDRLLHWEGPLDLMLWTRTWHLPQYPQREVLAAMRERGVPTVGYHLDKYWGLPREQQVRAEPWWSVDFMFTADGGNEERFADVGVRHHWMPPGVLAENCVEGQHRPELAADVIFIGSVFNYHPEWRHRQDLVACLAGSYSGRFRHYGRGGQQLAMEQTGDAIASAKVVIGDSCNVDGRGCYWSNRIPETLGRGGFLIHPRVDGIEDFYSDGVHLALFEPYDWDGLRSLIDAYLRRPDDARRVGLAGQELVRGRDTFTHKLRHVLEVVAAEFPRITSARDRLTLTSEFDRSTAWEIFDEEVYRARPFIEEGSVVVDVGANVGIFATWAAELGARVVAIEPLASNVERMIENLAAAQMVDRVDIQAVAVGDGLPVEVVPAGDGRDSWTRPGGDVPSRPLDVILEPFEEVAVLKLDIEGAEFDAILGADHETLQKCRFVTMEFHGPDGGRGPAHFAGIGWEQWGAMVAHLAETHGIEVIGRPSTGGYLYARRHT